MWRRATRMMLSGPWMRWSMGKWEERETRNEQARRADEVGYLRDRMSGDDSRARKREAERTAEQAVRKGTGMLPRE